MWIHCLPTNSVYLTRLKHISEGLVSNIIYYQYVSAVDSNRTWSQYSNLTGKSYSIWPTVAIKTATTTTTTTTTGNYILICKQMFTALNVLSGFGWWIFVGSDGTNI